MKNFDLWLEGWHATGGGNDATYLGRWKGRTFEDACDAWAHHKPARRLPDYHRNPYPKYWGCKIYDNEKDARASFG